MYMSYDIKLPVMHVDIPVGRVIFDDKMGKILKKKAFLTYFMKFSQNSLMKKAESINQCSRSQGVGNLESHTKGENFLSAEVLLLFCYKSGLFNISSHL